MAKRQSTKRSEELGTDAVNPTVHATPTGNGNGSANGHGNPLGMDDRQFSRFMNLVDNQMTMRLDWFRSTLDPRRNIFHECGWGDDGSNIDPWTYQRLYDREPIAARVVEVYPKETWQVQPMVYEEEDSDDITEFEDAWDVVSDSLMGDSWYKQEAGSPIWGFGRRADIQCGIGRYGVIFIGLDDGKPLDQPADYRTKTKPGNGRASRKLTMLRVLPESLAQIETLEEDQSNPRYMTPKFYNLNFADPNVQMYGPIAQDGKALSGTKVHWTRVLHIADNLGSSEILGVPRLQVPLNPCLDIQKVRGGSAEMYWRGAMPGWALETHPHLGPNAVIDPTKARDAFENMFQGLQRYIGLPGMTAKSLAPQVVDPNPQIKAQIEAICIYMGIPMRIFMGSERGQLASSQDDGHWNDRLRERQMNFVTPKIVIPLIDRLIALGVLPIPRSSKGAMIVNTGHFQKDSDGSVHYVKNQIRKPLKVGYCVEWPDLTSQSDQEKATVFATRMGAYAQYTGGGVEALIEPMDMLTREAGYTEEEARAIIDNAATAEEERQEKQIEQQHTMIDEGLAPDPTEPKVVEATESGDEKDNGAGNPYPWRHNGMWRRD